MFDTKMLHGILVRVSHGASRGDVPVARISTWRGSERGPPRRASSAPKSERSPPRLWGGEVRGCQRAQAGPEFFGGPRAFPVHPLSLFSFPSGAHAHARTSFARLCSLFMDTPKFRNCRKGRRPLTLGILRGSDWRRFGLAQSLRPEQLLLVI